MGAGRDRVRRMQIKFLLQQHSLQRRNPIRELALDLPVALESAAQSVHFRIEIVEMVQQEGFGEHRRLGRSKFELAVVA